MFTSKLSSLKCDHCGKSNHTAYKDGKPFCFKLIKALKEQSTDNKNNSRCRYCKTVGHEMADCPKLAKKKISEETGLNHLFIGTISCHNDCQPLEIYNVSSSEDDYQIHNVNSKNFVEVLGDSGAAMHVWPSNRVGNAKC